MILFYLDLTKVLILYNVMVSITARRDALLRAIGGRDVASGEFPYVVRLELLVNTDTTNKSSTNLHVCTASVLSPTVTLTAGHCCEYMENNKFVIRYGSAPGRPTEVDRFSEVLSCIKLPRGIDYNIMNDDLALLTTQPIPLSEYARLSALDHHTLNGQRITIVGYGLTNHSSGIMATTLELQMPLQVLEAMWSRCDIEMYPLSCAVTKCGQQVAVCAGDSGGPVAHTSGIVGVNSMKAAQNCKMGQDNNYSRKFDFIMPISSNINWISDKMAEIHSNKQYYH